MSSVAITSITMPVAPGVTTPEDLIVYTARVSNPDNQRNFDTSDKLLLYCWKNKHVSIFNMVDITFEINTTRDIGRQLLRHWSADFQEFSQRYADPSALGFTLREPRLQDTKNRQASIEIDDPTLESDWYRKQNEIIKVASDAYAWAIDNGIAKECARVVLPEGLTLSRLYMKNSLGSWMHYVELRTGNGTQKEHCLIAEEIKEHLKALFPFLKTIWAD